jgi:hypothetical protein
VAVLLWGLSLGAAADEASVATSTGEAGTLLARTGPEGAWQVVAPKADVHGGELLIGLPGAMLDSPNGAVRIVFRSDFDDLSPYPIRETAVQLGTEPHVDLDVILDRGRLELSNRKESGAAHVRLHVRQAAWDLTLAEPGTRLALELYGRWPRGTKFSPKVDNKNAPTANLTFLVLHGQVMVRHADQEATLKAPPGPALLEWDSVSGHDTTPHYLDKLPPWAASGVAETEHGKQRKAALERLRQALTSQSIDKVFDEFLNSDQELDRRLAIYGLAATDQLKRLGQALQESKHPEDLELGVQALRHWVGRGPGQDQRLFKGLIDAGFKPVHAATVVELLHSFGDADLEKPNTYQTLIDYLDHKHFAIRGLAYWHLERLAPAGREFGYRPSDPPEKRTDAIEKWRKLIPPGELPPNRRQTEKKDKE